MKEREEKMQNNKYNSYSIVNRAYMYGNCNTCAKMHNFTITDVGISFLSKYVK